MPNFSRRGTIVVAEQKTNAVQLLEINQDQAGQRIDNFLLARLKGVPRSRIYRLLRKGEVRVNKGRIGPQYRLQEDDVVRLPPIRVAERGQAVPGRSLRDLLADNILFEHKSCLVLNKPSGIAVHGGSGINLGVIEALRAMRPDEQRLELVHRLDRDTSGCLLIARNRASLRNLQEQMRERHIGKRYRALVRGQWPKDLGEVNAPLRKHTLASGERMVRAEKDGKRALTRFRVIQSFAQATLIEADLETGRTHQIRVHCQLAGHPLAGDLKYGDENFDKYLKTLGLKRLFLHARELEFALPGTDKRVKIEAPLPIDLAQLLERL